ncbi:DEAD/DEAH box helicase family protein [Nocardioides sp. SOB77]|uniref:DEAD/DEAH box helicase family protein n=1 Tax=Nocardioides oceani TaxID=3058369 RepID=A0ABT8FLM8_9ACTN|nr:DEAD/DEAH box helicase family protein [Nocardioides oceani]MDN4175579.1 DEAD/DEAH box helicase family protein [Nocardioides oceani]
MRYTLKDYQFVAANDICRALRRAGRDYDEDRNELWSIALSAPTGAGKTVIAAAVIETLFDGNDRFAADPEARVLWVTDDPALNVQTMRNMTQASTTLGPSRLVTIDSAFDQETFDANRVYFLNIQKLARTNPLTRGNTESRTYSLWQTIARTIETVGSHFYIVIDEAHRGMRAESDRPTIVSRIINGQEGINPPAPIVWGISATPERFNQAIARWASRSNNKMVPVPIEDVRASGLLKDKVILDNPRRGQVDGDTTLIRAGVEQTLEFERAWAAYAAEQGEPAVKPALVLQVPNRPSDAEMSEYLDAIFSEWSGLRDSNVVNTFGEHTALTIGGRVIPYMAPHEVQDDQSIRVVLCKDAISTGWDCPRAEVLVSLRRAEEYTYIAQMIGRMVRTPLARRIATNETLNDVHCYLPRFNRAQVDAITTRFREGSNDEPPVELVADPVILERSADVPATVYDLLGSLPTYVVPGRIYRSQVSRLFTMATLLAGDNIVEDAVSQARIHMNGVLRAQRQRLEADGSFQSGMARLRQLKIERSYVLLAADSLDDLPESTDYEVSRDDNNVDDLFRVAKRKLPEGVAINYWNELVRDQPDDDFDAAEAKAATAVLALHPDVIEAVESAADQLVRTWLRTHQRSINRLPDARKLAYEPVRRETRQPEMTELVVPTSRTVPDRDQRWPKHVLSASDGTFPSTHRGWEQKVLDKELADPELVGWYRNPTGGTAALRLPYRGERFDRSMYPDFIFFHRVSESSIRPSIIDPHGYHLTDAVVKLRGLADYAAEHGSHYDRIEAVAEIDDRLMSLDLLSSDIRDRVAAVAEDGVKTLYTEHGGNYD